MIAGHGHFRWLPVLATLSGACGLAYEILYIRLFSSYFGDSFLVSGVTLCAVFLGMSFGAWQSHKFLKRLAWIEIGIGLYAFGAALAFSNWGFEIAAIGAGTWLHGILLGILLGFPAFLIGTCVPLFSALMNTERRKQRDAFAGTYGLYNLGAFLSILVIEFFLIRQLGLQISSYLIGALNLIIGGSLLVLARGIDAKSSYLARTTLNPYISIALFLASFASGIFQLFVLYLSFSIFGPLHENFAIILASAIAGVAIGAWLAMKRMLLFQEALLWLTLFVLTFMIFVPILIDAWVFLSGTHISDQGEIVAKAALLAGFPLILFVLFGGLVPLAASAHEGNQTALSGRLLAISSLGNGLGAFAMFLILYRHLSLPVIGIGLACILLTAAWVTRRTRPAIPQVMGGVVIAATLVFAGLQIWPRVDLLLGYRILTQGEQLDERRDTFLKAEVYKAYDQNAAVLSFRDGSRSLVFNGYHSLSFGPGAKSELHEVIVGATPALFTEYTDEVLVLGLGTGITAGSSARIFNDVKIVEINPAILNIPKHFKRENHNVLSRSNADIVLQDGISTLLGDAQEYDAIINTVTSPKYYSASKLYTSDFLKLAKARLKDGGVYSTWFDLSIDRDGIGIMLNTLEDSFSHCRYFVLTESYYNAVCADHPLIYKSSKTVVSRVQDMGFDKLFEAFDFPDGFALTMNQLEVSFDKDFFKRPSTDVNTLDRPVIEFIVARNSDRVATIDALSQVILANIERQRQFSIGNQGWKERCKILARMSRLEFSGC